MPRKKSTPDNKGKSFEEALSRLEEIVNQLEEGELNLDDALRKFEEGIELSQFCARKLTQTEEKIKKLVKSAKGEFKTEDFEVDEE